MTGTGVGGCGGAEHGQVALRLFPAGGHLIIFEMPRECAEVAMRYLDSQLEAAITARNAAKESSFAPGTAVVSDEWRRRLKVEVARTRALKTKL